MQLTGEQRVAAPREKVWAALNDPAVLRESIPGCESLEQRAGGGFDAVVAVKIGPIGARFKGEVAIEDADAPNGYRLAGKGNAGIAGTANGAANVRLSDEGEGTLVSYTVDADVGGRLAQLGGPIVEATAKQLAAKFFAHFERAVTGGGALEPAAAPASQVAARRAEAPATPPPAGHSAAAWTLAGWLSVVALALIAGFVIGLGGASGLLVIMIAVLLLAVGGAAYLMGRMSGGGR